MGIGRAAIALLLEEAAARPFSGRLATLGRQTISATDQEVARQFARFGLSPATTKEDRLNDQKVFGMMDFAWSKVSTIPISRERHMCCGILPMLDPDTRVATTNTR